MVDAIARAGVTHTVELGFYHDPPYETDNRGSDLVLGTTVDLAFGVKQGC